MQIDLDPEKIRQDVVTRCVDEVLSGFDFQDEVSSRISDAIDKRMKSEVDTLVNRAMDDALKAALESSVSPVDIWGQPTGEPKTLKEHIHQRAKDFWQEAVDAKGDRKGYGGKPRYQYLLQGMLKDEFQDVIKDNINEVVVGLKEALRSDMRKALDANIDAFIKVGGRR